jgi:hypothetical protein
MAFALRWEKGPTTKREYSSWFQLITFVRDRWTGQGWVEGYGIDNEGPWYVVRPIKKEGINHPYWLRNGLTTAWLASVIIVSIWLWRSIKDKGD